MTKDPTKLLPVCERPDVLDRPIFPGNVPDVLTEKMLCGLSPREAVARASAWWDRTGRLLALQQMKRGVNYDPATDDIVVKSGIVLGLPWDRLDRRECLQVVRAYCRMFEQQQMGTLLDDRLPDPIIERHKARQRQRLKILAGEK